MAATPSQLYTTLYNTATQALLSHSQDKLGKDVQALSQYLANNCRRYFAPSAYSADAGIPDGLTNTEYEKLLAWQITLADKWSVEITEVLVDESKRSVMIWGKYKSIFKRSAGTFLLEVIQIVHMNQAGDRVEKIVEFLDNKEAERFDSTLREMQSQGDGDA